MYVWICKIVSNTFPNNLLKNSVHGCSVELEMNLQNRTYRKKKTLQGTEHSEMIY